MRGHTVYPFLVAEQNRVESVTPWLRKKGEDWEPIYDSVPDWDYNLNLNLTRRFKVDQAGIKEDCNLDELDELGLVSTWYSHGTKLRGSGKIERLNPAEKELECKTQLLVKGEKVSEKIRIGTQIVYLSGVEERPGLSADKKGNLLWGDSRQIHLEGSGERFPVEAVDFSEINQLPDDAGWYLDWVEAQLEKDFHSRGIVLFLNKSHEKVKKAISATNPDEEDKAIRSAIYHDVGRQLISGLLKNGEYIEGNTDLAPSSIGRSIYRLFKQVFPGRSIEEVKKMKKKKPVKFETKLQEEFDLFGGTSS